MTHNIKAIWRGGKIQRVFNIMYDVMWNVILFFLVIGFIGLFFAGGLGTGYFASLVKDEPIRSYSSMEQDIYNYEETSKLYFAGDVYFGDIRADLYREEVTLENVSDLLINAVIATEDQSFYDHDGVVPKAIIRAVLQEAINTNVKTGGSTLTQQLIKNQMLTNEVSFDRKAKEILLALRLEHFFEKDEILEAYLNIIPYGRNSSGRNIAGVQTASQGIFGLDADDVNIPQAAFLAGLPQSPSVYTPFISGGGLKDEEGLEAGLTRMKIVLKRMHDAEFINKEAYDDAINYDIIEDFTEQKQSTFEKYPRLANELEIRAKDILLETVAEEDSYTMDDLENNEQLKEEYETLVDNNLRRNGYNIYSSIDKDIYDNMQDVMVNHDYFGPDRKVSKKDEETGETVEWTEQQQAGGILIENKTGKIISFAGGREFEDSEINYTNRPRSPGSTFKPLVVYAPGMELGSLQPGTPLSDHNNIFKFPEHDPWTVDNYSKGSQYGIIPAREALAQSYNIHTVAAYKDIYTQDPARQFLGEMWEANDNKVYDRPSLSLGADDVTVEENTNMFSVFGNEGEYNESYMIEKITNQDDDIVYEHEDDPVNVFSKETAYLTIDILRDVIDSGTATYFKSQIKDDSVDWAGKTGTSSKHKDAWFIGVNPNVTFGAWTGYNTPTDIKKACPNCTLNHSQRIIKLWSELVNGAGDVGEDLVTSKENFKQPDDIVEKSICSISGMLPSDLCKKAGLVTTDIFNKKFVPTEEDDSLMKGSFVRVNGQSVIAGDKTPSEFVEGDGLTFNPEFLKDNGYDELDDITKLYPRQNHHLWEKISVPKGDIGEEIKSTGKKPSAPSSVNKSGQSISWQASNSKNVIGYRIYKASKPGGSFSRVGHTTSTSYSVGDGKAVYHVKAVDYFGLESSASKDVIIGDYSKNDKKDEKKAKDKENDKQDKDQDKEKDKDKEKDENNNNDDEDE